MSPSLSLAVALLLAGLFVLSLELFVPSAGLLFLVACCCIIASVFVAFQVHWSLGASFLGLITLLSVVLPGLGLQLWRRSPMGRQMFLEPKDETDDAPAAPSVHEGLRGEVGRTLTPLRPAGSTEINGRRVDTIAQGVMIDEGEMVKVVSVQGNRVVVRRLTERERAAASGDNTFEFI